MRSKTRVRSRRLLACPEFSPSRRRETRQLFADQGVSVCGLASSVRFDHESATDLLRDLDTGRRYVDLAADLGAGFVRVFGDTLPPLDNLRERDLRVTKMAGFMGVLADYAHRQARGLPLELQRLPLRRRQSPGAIHGRARRPGDAASGEGLQQQRLQERLQQQEPWAPPQPRPAGPGVGGAALHPQPPACLGR